MTRRRISEVASYVWIKNKLRDLGWNTNSPSRDPNGQVYTQQECRDHEALRDSLAGEFPEYIVKLCEDSFWVIEAKSRVENIQTAIKEAKDYGEKINGHASIQAKIVTGVAGNDIDGYGVTNYFLKGNQYGLITYNGQPITSLISPMQATNLLNTDSPQLADLVIDEKEMLAVAEEINETLHSASINKDERAPLIASLLLSLIGETSPDINANPSVLVGDINNRAKNVLEDKGKPEFYEHLKIRLPSQEAAQRKRKTAIIATITRLQELNIKAAMTSGTDVLGKFFEVFLKYGNGAKDLGIVFTPRHITKFTADVLGVSHQDIVYDPTCGTGGFLIAALDLVRGQSTSDQLNTFKNYGVFGVDSEPKVAALAVINMIFRGDGKNNIIDDDCMAKKLELSTINGVRSARFVDRSHEVSNPPVTRVFMNPPFALKEEDTKEYRFVTHALEQMETGGLLFSVLPLSVMNKGGAAKAWRNNMLIAHNTLLAVVTFPVDLFYPIGVHTCGIFVKKGVPHPEDQPLLWIRAINDGYRKIKGKRLLDSTIPNNLEQVLDLMRLFVLNPSTNVQNVPKFMKSDTIDWNDSLLELIPEAYLDEEDPNPQELRPKLEMIFRNAIAHIIKTNSTADLVRLIPRPLERKTLPTPSEFRLFDITDLFDLERGDFHSLDDLESGSYPTVSRLAENQGVEGFYEKPDGAKVYDKLLITVSTTSGDSFVQVEEFIATDNVVILKPKREFRIATLFFIQLMINETKWRWSYGRQCYKGKFQKTQIYLPVNSEGGIDEYYIEAFTENCVGYSELKNYLTS